MVKILFVFLFALSFPALASDGFGSFFSVASTFFSDIWLFITETIPKTITDFFKWLVTWLIYFKFTTIHNSILFANDIAMSFLDLVSLNEMINASVNGLPSDLRNVAIDIGFFEGLTLVIEALLTRMVYRMLN